MVRLDLVVAPRGCKKCDACRELVDELLKLHPGRIEARIFDTNSEEAIRYGVVLPPTMALDDFIIAAGNVPRKEAVFELVKQAVEGDETDGGQ